MNTTTTYEATSTTTGRVFTRKSNRYEFKYAVIQTRKDGKQFAGWHVDIAKAQANLAWDISQGDASEIVEVTAR